MIFLNNYLYGGASDIGYKREINEDYINIVELDNSTLFAAVADGAGSKCSTLQPASIAAAEIFQEIQRIFQQDKALFLEHTDLFLRETIGMANRVVGAFKMGNEELYAGFGTGFTCCVCMADGKFTFAHVGNSRIYLIRLHPKDRTPTIRQLTQDHTQARQLLDAGLLAPEHYYSHPDRLVVTSCLGVTSEPIIQINSGRLKPDDILLMTTDGIHYAIIPNAIMQLVIGSQTCDNAVHALIEAAKMQKYPDNMSAIVIWNRNKS